MPDPPSTPLPPQKRRRLDAATSILKKPFRSPLLNRPPGSSASTPPTFSLTPPSTSTKSNTAPSSFSTTTKNVSTPTPTPVRRPLFSAITTLASTDPELASAQKKYTRLLSEQRTLKQSLETVTQALALEAAPRGDEELVASIRKWTDAARGAADTLFGIAGDKVNQMGGPGGDSWRRMMGGGFGGKRSFGWDEDEPKREQGDDDDEGLGGEDEMEEERMKGAEKAEEWGMGLMLKTLGIPDKMLGWDREAATWRSLEEV